MPVPSSASTTNNTALPGDTNFIGPVQPTSTPPPQSPKWTFPNNNSEDPSLYNNSFIEATRQLPVSVCDMELAFVWTENGTVTKRIDLYPSTKVIPDIQTDGSSSTTNKDHIFLAIAKAAAFSKYNFIRNITCKRYTQVGGNTLELQLIDPSGYIIDQALINTYLMQMLVKGSNIHCELSYGWAGDPKKRRVSTNANWILYNMSVQTEYTGASYTLKFVDVASNLLNVKTDGWQIRPDLSDKSFGDADQNYTFLEALQLFWSGFHEAGHDIDSTKPPVKCILMTCTTDSAAANHALPLSAWKQSSFWKGPIKPLHNWAPGDQTILSWIQNNLSNQNAPMCGDGKYYTVTFVDATHGLSGKPDQYLYYEPASKSWEALKSDMYANKLNQITHTPERWFIGDGKTGSTSNTSNQTIMGPSYMAILITEDIQRIAMQKAQDQAASSDTTETITPSVSEGFVRKRYRYLTGGLDPYNTILKMNVDSSSLFGRYLMRARSGAYIAGEQNATSDTDPGGEKDGIYSAPTEKTQKDTFSSGLATMPVGAGNPADKKTLDAISKARNNYTAAMAFAAISVSLEVIGDPDLGEALRNYVQIDLGEQSAATLPWIKGTYLLIYINDSITDGIWTSELQLLKMGPYESNDKPTASVTSSTPAIPSAVTNRAGSANSVPGASLQSETPKDIPADTTWNAIANPNSYTPEQIAQYANDPNFSVTVVNPSVDTANKTAAQKTNTPPMLSAHAQGGISALVAEENQREAEDRSANPATVSI